MSVVDLVIHNGRVVTPSGVLRAGVAVDDGRIVAIAEETHLPENREALDARGMLVLPGGIDPHVHLHPRGYEYRGDFGSNSLAAAAGGTTTFIDFIPPTPESYRTAIPKRLKEAEVSAVDFAFHAVVLNEEHVRDLAWARDQGVVSFKFFMSGLDGVPAVSRGLQLAAFEKLAELEVPAIVHAESDEINRYLQARMKAEGRNDALAHARSRPICSECEAIQAAVEMARWAGNRLHIFHITSREAAELVRNAKGRGLPVTGETCPHYLLLGEEDLPRLGPLLQMTPPIRPRRSGEGLWDLLADGTIDCIVSDHYAPLKHEKGPGFDYIWNIEGGVPGVETRMMLTFNEGVMGGRLSLERWVETCTSRAAEIFGLDNQKGGIVVGKDADLVLWNDDAPFEINPDELKTVTDWTPFEGMKGSGRADTVLVGGRPVMRNGELVAEPGKGVFLPAGGAPALV
ncbi:MAG: amidohydrolase family protein [Nitrospinota bacterium]|nr:amidohydrolase family protein [Nitrospinota bacterium]